MAEASHCEFILVKLCDRLAIVRSADCVILPSLTPPDPSLPVARVEIPSSVAATSVPISDDEGDPAISRVAVAAELLGIANLGLESAVTHSVSRVQFDKPIGAFQSVKHRLADLFVSIHKARGLIEHVAQLCDEGEVSAIAISHLAYAAAAEAAVDAARTNVRFHGAMGATWELDAHLILRRVRHLTQLFGSPGENYRRGALGLDRRFQ